MTSCLPTGSGRHRRAAISSSTPQPDHQRIGGRPARRSPPRAGRPPGGPVRPPTPRARPQCGGSARPDRLRRMVGLAITDPRLGRDRRRLWPAALHGHRIEPHWVAKDASRFLTVAQELDRLSPRSAASEEVRIDEEAGLLIGRRSLMRPPGVWRVAAKTPDPPRSKTVYPAPRVPAGDERTPARPGRRRAATRRAPAKTGARARRELRACARRQAGTAEPPPARAACGAPGSRPRGRRSGRS